MNNKMALPKWRDKTEMEKLLFVLQILICILALIFSRRLNVWGLEFNVVQPLLGINFILSFIQYRKYDKFTSYIFLAVAIFAFMTMFRK